MQRGTVLPAALLARDDLGFRLRQSVPGLSATLPVLQIDVDGGSLRRPGKAIAGPCRASSAGYVCLASTATVAAFPAGRHQAQTRRSWRRCLEVNRGHRSRPTLWSLGFRPMSCPNRAPWRRSVVDRTSCHWSSYGFNGGLRPNARMVISAASTGTPNLLSASRCRCHGLAVFSPWPPRASYICARVRIPPSYCPAASSAFRLLSRVGEGDISALRCGLTGSCSSTFQYFSLGNHLGLTASPQSPLPAGYVTLPVDGRSPPLGLMPPHSRGQVIFSHSSFLFCIPVICSPLSGRGARYVKSETHSMFGAGRMELAIDMIERARCGLVADRGADRLAADDPFRPIAASDAPPCSGRHRSLRAATAARPCERRRRGSSPRTRVGPHPSRPHPASPEPTAGTDRSRLATWAW